MCENCDFGGEIVTLSDGIRESEKERTSGNEKERKEAAWK